MKAWLVVDGVEILLDIFSCLNEVQYRQGGVEVGVHCSKSVSEIRRAEKMRSVPFAESKDVGKGNTREKSASQLS